MKKYSAILIFLFLMLSCNEAKKAGLNLAGLLTLGAGAQAPSGTQGSTANTPLTNNAPDESLALVNPNLAAPNYVNPCPLTNSCIGGSGTGTTALLPSFRFEIDTPATTEYRGGSSFSFPVSAPTLVTNRTIRIVNQSSATANLTATLNLFTTAPAGTFQIWDGPSLLTMPFVMTPTLAPNTSKTYTLRFTPPAAGSYFASLQISHNDPNAVDVNSALTTVLLMQVFGRGTDTPTATVMKPLTDVDRFDNIVIEFSHPMNQSTICSDSTTNVSANFSLAEVGPTVQLLGTCYWGSNRQLIFDPFRPLTNSKAHRISFGASTATAFATSLVNTCVGATCLPGLVSPNFTTEAQFNVTGVNLRTTTPSTINMPYGNNFPDANNRGITVDANIINNNLNFTGTLNDGTLNVGGLYLYKLGSTEVVTLCAAACGATNFAISTANLITLAQTTMRPTLGTNTYYFEIRTALKSYIRSYSFNWGNPAISQSTTNAPPPDPSSHGFIQGVGSLLLDKSSVLGSAINAVEVVVRRFARQQFTLNGLTLNEIVYNTRMVHNNGAGGTTLFLTDVSGLSIGMMVVNSTFPNQTASPFLTITAINSVLNTITVSASVPAIPSASPLKASFRGISAPASDALGNSCIPWTKGLPVPQPFQILYLNKIGPICGVTVTGTIFNSMTFSPVRYAARADIYVTELNIPPVANPGALDNLTVTLNPATGLLDVEIFGKKATGKMAMVARIPQATLTCNTTNGNPNLTSCSSTANIIPGMIISGPGIASGTYVKQVVSGTQILMGDGVDPVMNNVNAGATASSVSLNFDGVEFFSFLVGDTYVYTNDNTYNGTPIRDGDALNFAMNEDPPVLTDQYASARTIASVASYDLNNTFGRLGVALSTGLPPWSFAQNNAAVGVNSIATSVPFWFPSMLLNPITPQWSNAITVDPLSGTGAIAAIVADIVNQKIPEVKPQVVQRIIKDVAERVAPDIVNSILSNLYKGININLPSYLPGNFKNSKLGLSASLNTDATVTSAGIDSSANLRLDGCIKPGTGTGSCITPVSAPPNAFTATGVVDSFLRFQREVTVNCTSTSGSPNLTACTCAGPFPCSTVNNGTGSGFVSGMFIRGTNLASNSFVTASTVNSITLNKNASTSGASTFIGTLPVGINQIRTVTNNQNGVMLALHADAVGQLLYRLWRNGILNITLNAQFLDDIANNQYVGDTTGYRASTRILEIFTMLLRGTNILKILAPGRTTLSVRDQFDNPYTIEQDDDIYFNVRPIQVPMIRSNTTGVSRTVTGNKSGSISGQINFVDINFGDLYLEIMGQKCTTRNSTTGICTVLNGAPYLIVRLKVSMGSKATFSISPFSNPLSDSQYIQTIPGVGTSPVSAIKLNICDDIVSGDPNDCDQDGTIDLIYTLEIPDNVVDNPLGLSPRGLYDIFNPSIQKLVVPLVNYVLEEIPLPVMQNCGLWVYDVSVLPTPVPANIGTAFFNANAKLANYNFTGDCSL